MRTSRSHLTLIIASAFAMAACGGSAHPTTTPTPRPVPSHPTHTTASPTAVGPLITNASTTVASLLALAPQGTAISNDLPTPWTTAVPGLTFEPATAAATDTSVSGNALTTMGNGPASIDFAVMDSSARCAGGIVTANAAGTSVASSTSVAMPLGDPCTGAQVALVAAEPSMSPSLPS